MIRGELVINCDRYMAWWKGQRVYLTATELRVVLAIAKVPGTPSHEAVAAARRGARRNSDLRTGNKDFIKRIRLKFRLVDPAFDGITADYGVGYRWREPCGGGKVRSGDRVIVSGSVTNPC